MDVQNQIKRRLSDPNAIERIRNLLDKSGNIHRSELAKRLCRHFKFFDGRGKEQLGGCLKALKELESKGHFHLPKPRTRPGNKEPRRLEAPLPVPQGIPADVSELSGLQLELVTTGRQMKIWNEMMIEDHPRGAGPLVGRQLRYLVVSDHGFLGGFGFSSAALYLDKRDRWIGWDGAIRKSYLERIVGLNRFLIRKCVRCRNLATRVMGICLHRFEEDFEQRYGLRPWLLESFVDSSRFYGGCYRAANWRCIGQTCGRGRQDRKMETPETIKDIYVHILDHDFRNKMGLPRGSGLGPLEIAESLDAEGWADREFGDAPLGDARLTKRLVSSAEIQAEKPGQTFTGAAEGNWAAIKGYYRLIDQPEESGVSMDSILLPHRRQTLRRMEAQKTVLCIQDGSDLNYTSLAQCQGLGTIGRNQTGASSRGLHLHSTFAVTTEGLPLGVLQAQCWAPQSKSKDDDRPSSSIPIEEKESFAWIRGLRDCSELSKKIPHTKLVNVMDREADFFELFDEHRQNPCVDLLVRAQYNRCTTDDSNLFDAVRNTAVQGQLCIEVQRKSARPKLSKKKACCKRDARVAEVALRYKRVELRPPWYHSDKDPVPISIVHVVEENPPEGAIQLEWFLLTTIKITSVDMAETCLRWYCLRWRIEDWHRVLKSGCRIEDAAHRTQERLKRATAINLVIAWRIMLMTLLGREAPELPAEVLFSNIEIEVLTAYSKKKRLTMPLMLGDTVRLVARIGGYIGRNHDPPPGHEIMWRGYIKLRLMCDGFVLRDT